MTRVYAIVENGMVVNTILAENWPEGLDITNVTPMPGIGWGYDGTNFTPPPPPGPTPEPPPVDYGTRVTKLAFRQRLGQPALVAIELAAIHNPAGTPQQQQLAAGLRVMLEDVRVATFIDLARPDTRAGVQQLEAVGLIPTGKAAEVLDTPVRADEVPIL